MIKVNSVVKLNIPKIRKLTQAQVTALEQTAEALHTEVVQAEIMPRDTGAMQNESTFVDCSRSSDGRVTIATSTPYARRLYFHPEYNFSKEENPNTRIAKNEILVTPIVEEQIVLKSNNTDNQREIVTNLNKTFFS